MKTLRFHVSAKAPPPRGSWTRSGLRGFTPQSNVSFKRSGLQAALVSSLGTLSADHFQISQNSGLETLDLGQILIPHLGVGQHGVHQLSSGVVLVCIVEVQSPCVILDLVGVAGRALADQPSAVRS